MAELSSWDREPNVYKAWNNYYLTLYRKSDNFWSNYPTPTQKKTWISCLLFLYKLTVSKYTLNYGQSWTVPALFYVYIFISIWLLEWCGMLWNASERDLLQNGAKQDLWARFSGLWVPVAPTPGFHIETQKLHAGLAPSPLPPQRNFLIMKKFSRGNQSETLLLEFHQT